MDEQADRDVVIIATTWAPLGEVGESRLRSAKRAVASWRDNLRYEDGVIRLHVADDGSALPDVVGDTLAVWGQDLHTSATTQQRKGVGASLNAGIQAAREAGIDLVAYFVDDWELTAPFDLTPWARLLFEHDDIGAVRFGPPHPWLQAKIDHFEGRWAARLDRVHFAFSHRPTLYHMRFFDAYGEHSEGCTAMDAEWRYNNKFLMRPGPDIYLALPHPWEHIGEVEVGDVVPGVAERLQ